MSLHTGDTEDSAKNLFDMRNPFSKTTGHKIIRAFLSHKNKHGKKKVRKTPTLKINKKLRSESNTGSDRFHNSTLKTPVEETEEDPGGLKRRLRGKERHFLLRLTAQTLFSGPELT